MLLYFEIYYNKNGIYPIIIRFVPLLFLKSIDIKESVMEYLFNIIHFSLSQVKFILI
jgi:hypothetical protein